MRTKQKINNLIVFIITLFLLPLTKAYSSQTNLEKKELELLYKNEGYFKSISHIEIYKNFLFIVDFKGSQVLKYRFNNIKGADFIGSIGTLGQGPGDIQKPYFVSIDEDIVSIKDQGFVSFFDIRGTFIGKFRLFSSHMDSIFKNGKFYILVANPKSPHLIEVYTINGKKINSFGEKYLELKYKIDKGLPAPIIEDIIYNGTLLSDGEFIYYINRRFGTIHKFSMDGKLILKKNLLPLFGKNGKRKSDANKKLFIDNEYRMSKKNPRVRCFNIYLEAKLLEDEIYFLLDQHNRIENKPIFAVEIISISKNSFNIKSKYKTLLSKGEWLNKFSVKMEKMTPVFILDISSKEGDILYEFKPIEK